MKKYLISLIITMLLIPPSLALAEETEYIQTEGMMSRQGAVVGQVISKSDRNGRYIVYGRLSLIGSNGYKVYQTGKFFFIEPNYEGTDKQLENRIGQGVKVFGLVEMVRNSANNEILYAEKVDDYFPSDDTGILESAYGSGIGPFEWVGFGVAKIQLQNDNLDLAKSTTLINSLASFRGLLLRDSRIFESTGDKEKNRVFEYKKDDKTFIVEGKTEFSETDVADALVADNVKEHIYLTTPDFRKDIRTYWQSTWKKTWLIEKSIQAGEELNSTIKGTCFLTGLKGRLNSLVESAPILRPDIDKFMTYLEQLIKAKEFGLDDCSEWGSSALFYGKINIGSGQGEYIGPYFPADEPRKFVNTLVAFKTTGSMGTTDTKDSKDQFKNIEKWQIGWQARGDDDHSVKGLDIKDIIYYQRYPNWMTGERVLVYKLVYHPPWQKKASISYDHVNNGKLDTDNPPVYTDITWIGQYIKPNQIVPQPEYQYMLNLVRMLAFKGGV